MPNAMEVGRQRGVYGPGGDPAGRAELEAEARLQSSLGALEALLDGTTGGLSPEAILMVTDRQVSAINDDIMGDMRAMGAHTEMSRDLREVMNAIQANLGGSSNTDAGTEVLNPEALVPGHTPPQTYRQLMESAGVPSADIDASLHDGVITRGGAEHFLEILQNRAHDISDESDSLSVRLQQAVSRRSQMMQLASNLLQSMHETARGIIQNTH